jgi:hypothetical protein
LEQGARVVVDVKLFGEHADVCPQQYSNTQVDVGASVVVVVLVVPPGVVLVVVVLVVVVLVVVVVTHGGAIVVLVVVVLVLVVPESVVVLVDVLVVVQLVILVRHRLTTVPMGTLAMPLISMALPVMPPMGTNVPPGQGRTCWKT